MGNHFYLWQGIHVVTNPATDSLANMLHIIKAFDDAIIINAKEKGTAQAIGKALTLFNQLLGFFSSSITLKSYAVHSAIRVFNSIVYEYSFLISRRYTFLLRTRHKNIVSRVI